MVGLKPHTLSLGNEKLRHSTRFRLLGALEERAMHSGLPVV